MSFHTSHAALFAIGATVIGTTLNTVCGHPVDLNNIDYAAIGSAIIALFLDMYKRRNQAPPAIKA